MMKTRLKRILASALLATSLSASAAEGDYKVELVIFAQSSPGAGALPYNSTTEEAPDTSGAVSLKAYNGAPLSRFEMLPSSSLTLSDEAARLRRQGYAILWQGGWYQHIGTGRNPKIRLSSGDGRVDGVVQLDRSRYLHLRPDLLLSRTAAGTPYHLQQSRRMRSGKLHYLDHPRFGILAIINPIR